MIILESYLINLYFLFLSFSLSLFLSFSLSLFLSFSLSLFLSFSLSLFLSFSLSLFLSFSLSLFLSLFIYLFHLFFLPAGLSACLSFRQAKTPSNIRLGWMCVSVLDSSLKPVIPQLIDAFSVPGGLQLNGSLAPKYQLVGSEKHTSVAYHSIH